MDWEQLSDTDLKVLEQQIKRSPRGVTGCVKRCRRGQPYAIVTKAIVSEDGDDTEVFPTLFWLSCPALQKSLARLESTGWLEKLQRMIDDNDELRQALHAAHQEYAYLRRHSLAPEEYDQLRESSGKQADIIDNTGVAGVRNLGRIKCLHAHYAHYLATRNNPIGQLVEIILQETEMKGCADCVEKMEKPAGETE